MPVGDERDGWKREGMKGKNGKRERGEGRIIGEVAGTGAWWRRTREWVRWGIGIRISDGDRIVHSWTVFLFFSFFFLLIRLRPLRLLSLFRANLILLSCNSRAFSIFGKLLSSPSWLWKFFLCSTTFQANTFLSETANISYTINGLKMVYKKKPIYAL